MKFEFDPEKSEANKIKHGIDFVEAQVLWGDPDRLQVFARTQGEPRLILIGRIHDKHWSAVFTIRGDVTRIISVRRCRTTEVESMKSETFDKKFDAGEDVSKYLDFANATRPGREQKRVNVDFPVWMIQSLDREAKRLGVPRQSVIKVWIADRLEHAHV